jgi:hypothetical protein
MGLAGYIAGMLNVVASYSAMTRSFTALGSVQDDNKNNQAESIIS